MPGRQEISRGDRDSGAAIFKAVDGVSDSVGGEVSVSLDELVPVLLVVTKVSIVLAAKVGNRGCGEPDGKNHQNEGSETIEHFRSE